MSANSIKEQLGPAYAPVTPAGAIPSLQAKETCVLSELWELC